MLTTRPTTESGVPYDVTVDALLNMSHRAVGATEWIVEVATLPIPVALSAAVCTHQDAVCPDCYDSWATDYVFIEPVPGA